LRTAYTGNAIRVRRSSDNAEQNIGFTALGNLDTTALTSFCSGTNGFVTTWYDQSGNARNAIQTSAANQPQIVSSGSVLTENGKPCVNFTSTDKNLATLTQNDIFNDCTISYVCRQISNIGNFVGVFGYGDNGQEAKNRYLGIAPSNFLVFIIFGSDYISTINATGDTTINLYSSNYIMSTNGLTTYKNATSQSGSPRTLGTITTSSSFSINSIANRYSGGTINFSEGVFYDFDNNSNLNGIRANQNTFYGIY
jgi:hypothetical protein